MTRLQPQSSHEQTDRPSRMAAAAPGGADPKDDAHAKDTDTKRPTEPKGGLGTEDKQQADGGGGSDTRSGTKTKTGLGAEPLPGRRHTDGGGGSDTGGGGGPKTGLGSEPVPTSRKAPDPSPGPKTEPKTGLGGEPIDG